MAGPRTPIVKDWKELEDGDHLFHTAMHFPLLPTFVYTHHGIYEETGNSVISFNEIAMDKRNRELPGKEGVMELTARTLRRKALRAAAYLMGKRPSKIVTQYLDDFKMQDLPGRNFLVYKYNGEDPEQTEAAHDPYTVDGVSPDYVRNTAKAAVIARWFRDNASEKFGMYDLETLNCEHFATFCKTCRCDDVSILKTLVDEAGDGVVDKQRWEDQSTLRSLQATRFIDGVAGIWRALGKLTGEDWEDLSEFGVDRSEIPSDRVLPR